MASFRDDRRSGSEDVANAFLEGLRRWIGADPSPGPVELRLALLGWLRDAQRAQPTMALIHQLAARALEVADTAVTRGDRVADLRRALEESCAAELADLAMIRRAVVQQAMKLLSGRGAWIATLSSSALVRDALLAAHEAGHEPRVLIAESRPLNEGRALASALAARGIETWLVVDAALPLVLSQAQQLWIGADAITELGVLNKIGSFAAALAAREHSVPAYALASRRKFLPAATAALRIDEMPPAEVWENPPDRVKPRNVYFELAPIQLFRGLVVEDAVLPPGEASQLARERPLPRELATT
jgi:translation initiation factor 2B subunit (eIF-2B alpha/beta/delta family)